MALTGSKPLVQDVNATVQTNNSAAATDTAATSQLTFTSRWTEVHPVSSVANCSQPNNAGSSECKWALESTPLQLRRSFSPYIVKARASGVYVSLQDDTTSKVCFLLSCECIMHHCGGLGSLEGLLALLPTPRVTDCMPFAKCAGKLRLRGQTNRYMCRREQTQRSSFCRT